jgi:hypothetical protein
LKDGFAKWVSQSNISLLEAAFDAYATHENLLLHFILGLDLRHADMKNELLAFSSKLQRSRNDIHSAQEFTLTSFRAGESPLDQPEMVRGPRK